MSELWKSYRDLIKPAPLWEEQAYYGGYRWIEYDSTRWISRKYEPQLAIVKEIICGEKQATCNLYCVQELMNILKSAGIVQIKLGDTACVESNLFNSNDMHYKHEELYGKVQFVKPETEISRLNKIMSWILRYPSTYILGSNPTITKISKFLIGRDFPVYTATLEACGEYVENSLKLMHQSCLLIPHENVGLKKSILNWSNVLTL